MGPARVAWLQIRRVKNGPIHGIGPRGLPPNYGLLYLRLDFRAAFLRVLTAARFRGRLATLAA